MRLALPSLLPNLQLESFLATATRLPADVPFALGYFVSEETSSEMSIAEKPALLARF